jgi:hypothetical protein
VTVVWSDRGTSNPNATEGCLGENAEAPDYDPCGAGPGSDTDVYRADSDDGGVTWSDRTLITNGGGAHQCPRGLTTSPTALVAAWDQDDGPAPADAFHHVYWNGTTVEPLGGPEHIDVSVTHRAGQYVPEGSWPTICGPAASSSPGKNCNVFHGDHTGLQVGPDDGVHITWTGLNREVTSPQVDPYTGERHEGYAQEAMYARR